MPLLFEDNKFLGEQMRAARKRMHFTQAQCAERLEISTTFYKEIERNKNSPSLELY